LEISKSVLEWREGDEITSEHRNALAANIAHAFNLSPQKEAETREEYARIPEAAIAGGLAVMIAQELRMNADTFKQNFPTIARESKSLSVQEYLKLRDQIAEIPDKSSDLGQIG
jgi:hypothetical protein